MEEEIGLRQILNSLRKRWMILVALPLISILLGGFVNYYVKKPSYEATTTLIIAQKNSSTNPGEGQLNDYKALLDSQLLYKTLLENQQLTATYSVLAKSRTVESKVIEVLKLSMDVKALDGLITVTQLKNTEILEIKATTGNPELSASIANTTAQELSNAAVKESVAIIDKAIIPGDPLQQNKKLNVLTAFVIGTIASLGLIFLLETTPSRINKAPRRP